VNCLSAGNSFATKFSPTLCSRSVFHVGVIHKYALLWSIANHVVTHCWLSVYWEEIAHGTDNSCLVLITAAYCAKIIHRFIIFVHSKSYRPSSMLSHRQNSHASSGWKHTSRPEAGSRERVNSFKNVPVCKGSPFLVLRVTFVFCFCEGEGAFVLILLYWSFLNMLLMVFSSVLFASFVIGYVCTPFNW
jgi:hypothetical protein